MGRRDISGARADGRPVPAPTERSTYRTSLAGYEFGIGVEIKATDRFRSEIGIGS